jgi:hypothetical protein
MYEERVRYIEMEADAIKNETHASWIAMMSELDARRQESITNAESRKRTCEVAYVQQYETTVEQARIEYSVSLLISPFVMSCHLIYNFSEIYIETKERIKAGNDVRAL